MNKNFEKKSLEILIYIDQKSTFSGCLSRGQKKPRGGDPKSWLLTSEVAEMTFYDFSTINISDILLQIQYYLQATISGFVIRHFF